VEYLRIKNWEQYQHYKERNPPWIKLHNKILDCYEYGCLQDASKLLLLSLYLLASRTDNKIPNDMFWIKSKAMLKGKVDIKPLIKHGFIEVIGNASTVLATRMQNADSETETETEESRGDICANRFNAFWNAYPKKRNKGQAEKAFKKIKPSQDLLNKMLMAISCACECKDWRKSDGKYIPYPATWLNAKGWEDDYGDEEKNNDSPRVEYIKDIVERRGY